MTKGKIEKEETRKQRSKATKRKEGKESAPSLGPAFGLRYPWINTGFSTSRAGGQVREAFSVSGLPQTSHPTMQSVLNYF